MKSIKLSKVEKRILNIIANRGKAVSRLEITQIANVSSRTVTDTVAKLRSKGIPIVSERNGKNAGYSIAKDEIDRNKCVAMLTSQATSMMNNINSLANADLKNWDKRII